MGVWFLNVVVKCGDGLFSLHRFDPIAHLFYKSADAATIAAKKRIRSTKLNSDQLKLPAPIAKFLGYSSSDTIKPMDDDVFARFGSNTILHSNGAGHVSLYDTSSDSFMGLKRMLAPKGRHRVVVSSIPRTIAHASSSAGWWDDLGIKHDAEEEATLFRQNNGSNTECLYVMDLAPAADDPGRCCFELLSCISDHWVWRPLPPPPFLGLPGYVPSTVPSWAVHGDGTTIYLSPSTTTGCKAENGNHGVGTYAFDTVTLEWRKAGVRALPFYGNAEYVPELGRWIGLSRCKPYHICAAVSSLESPTVQCAWPDLDPPPENLLLVDLTVVNLGDGRFCAVKYYDDPEELQPVVVFTGVELHRYWGDPDLGFTTHKSKRY